MIAFNQGMSTDHEVSALHRLDLNLLVAFDTLARERSVTRAAQQAGVTQSAMSHTLRRLRELFGDPLLVRGKAARGRGAMELTPRAEALAAPVRASLVGLARALSASPELTPATLRRTFRVVSPDLFDVLVLPRLLDAFAREAPQVSVAIVPRPASLEAALLTGDVDLAVVPVLAPVFGETGPELRRRTLFRDTFRTFLRAGHPAASGRRLSKKRFLALPHLMVSPAGEGPGLVDHALAEAGESRRVALRVPTFAAALRIVAQTDLLLTAPAALARAAPDGEVVSVPTPLPLPEHAVTICWHPRFSEDPAHRWLRERLDEASRPLGARRRISGASSARR